MFPLPRRHSWIAAAVIGIFTARAATAFAQDLKLLPVDALVPEVRLATLEGEPIDLSRWVGKKPVLIEFWATWCGNCKKLAPTIDAMYEKYSGQVEFITVAVEWDQTAQSVQAHLKEHALHGRVLWDKDKAAQQAFGAPGTAWVVLIGANGRVAVNGPGLRTDLDAALAKLVADR